ncbi:hypothetical protein EMPG_17106 [Blastomyces silverae]|uniref:Serine hydrolase domain-containing protein n=1 Tax=Blastomyces silverae TaxID=2060906 RepID=A0A0H1B8L6_9EURO|nr:hypothetical protein EMPG_17106 [Blastomyces silverae]
MPLLIHELFLDIQNPDRLYSTSYVAAIRYELGGDHEYHFVEGCLPWPIAPEITSLVTSKEETFAYYNPDSPETILKALDDLDRYIEDEGPFDGVLGFSQGAVLAASFGVRKYQQDPANQRINPILKCNILISAALPLSWQDLLRGEVHYVTTKQSEEDPVNVPTVIIWGQEDPHLPNFDAVILELRRSPNVVTCKHSGGHEVPSSTAMEALAETVKMIKRTIDMARKRHVISS